MSKFQFSFKKKEEKPFIKPVNQIQFISKDEDEDKEKDEFITSICNNQIETKIKPVEKEELVIPLRESKRSKLLYKRNKKVKTENEIKDESNEQIENDLKKEFKSEINDLNNSNDQNDLKDQNDSKDQNDLKDQTIKIKKERDLTEQSLDEQARRELLNEAMGKSEIKKENDLVIQSNNVKNNQELDEDTEEADYSKVKVEDFAMALLRGMTKNKDDLKQSKIYEPKACPGGIGLGFEKHLKREKLKNNKKKRYLPGQDDDEDDIEKKDPDEIVDKDAKIGSLVCIEHGKQSGYYGQIVSISEDLTICEIKLSLSKQILSLPCGLIRLVSKKEYNKEAKVLNRSKYDEFKNK